MILGELVVLVSTVISILGLSLGWIKSKGVTALGVITVLGLIGTLFRVATYIAANWDKVIF